ncbi:MAG: NAD(P)-dependent oxidoreductase [Anaerolineales bacterium]
MQVFWEFLPFAARRRSGRYPGLGARQTVVIGRGHVAARKIEGLLAANAQVKVISPALTPEL